MTQTRRMLVLRAVVEDYIRTQEPIGSATLLHNHHLPVSSATIRKDMASLEHEGYLVQPHTSAGRIPTELGYRYYVDSLAQIVPLSSQQQDAIRAFLHTGTSLQDTLQRAAQLLNKFTGQVAVVASPALSKSRLWHLELIPVAEHTVLAVVVTDTGRVAQHIIELDEMPSAQELQEVCTTVNAQCSTLTLTQAAAQCSAIGSDQSFTPALQSLLKRLHTALLAMADEEYTHELFMSGVSSLAHQHTSAQELAAVFDALEKHASLIHLMSNVSHSSQSRGVGVAIGSETHTPGLIHAAVISSGYGQTAMADEPLAFIGSIGPTHMNYEIAMASVHAVAQYLTSYLRHDTNEE